jgi:hypothetical protein
MQQILCGKRMSVDYVEEARDCVLFIGGCRAAGETWDVVIWRAVTRTGLPYRRLWSYLYRRIQRPTADDMDVLRMARERQRALLKERLANEKLDLDWAREVGAFGRMFEDEGEAQARSNHAAVQPMAAHPHSAGR